MTSEADTAGSPAGHAPIQAIETFLLECSQALTGAADSEAAERGAGVFAEALERSTPTPTSYEPSWLPVLDTVDRLADEPLANRLASVAPHLPWAPSPRSDDGGTAMALALLDTTRDFGPVRVGLMYLGPGAQYPLHSHPPQELYLTVAGTARWRHGGHDDLRPIGPLRSLYNNPDDLHTAIAGACPVVALYVLWDDDPVDA